MTTTEKIILTAQKRELVGKKVQALRKQGLIPAVLYGQGKTNQLLTIDGAQFRKIFTEVGETGLIYVKIDDTEVPSIIRDHQIDPIKNQNLHIDLMAVNLAEKIEADVPLSFIGISPAVQNLDGTLIEVKNQIHVEALPQDLVPEIEVDIAQLKNLENDLRIKDIAPPKGVTILDDPEETIAIIEPPKTEEELAAELAEPVSEEEAVSKVESETKEGTEPTSEESSEQKQKNGNS